MNSISAALLVLFGLSLSLIQGKDLGKMECTEKEGLKPDSKLINTIIGKCQPKQGQDEKTIGACLVKCLMKQQKALDKKGKLKMKQAKEIITIFPPEFQDKITAKLEECAKAHGNELKKEPSGCESWLPFSGCFYSYGNELCPTEKQRLEMANGTLAATTGAPLSE